MGRARWKTKITRDQARAFGWACCLAGGVFLVIELATASTIRATSLGTLVPAAFLFVGLILCLPRAPYSRAREANERVSTLSEERLRTTDRMTVVNQVAMSLAREIGTPLNVISGRAMMLPDANNAEIVSNARIIVEQTLRIEHMIRRLLNYARGRGVGKRELDLRVLIREAADLFEPVALKRGVRLSLEAPVQPVYVLADPESLLQVLSDLAMNGIESMTHGGTLTLGISTHQSRAAEEAEDGGSACIFVRDEGHGIAAEHRGTIFEPFFTTKSEPEAMGLGLTVSQAIVREHGGFIDFQSEVGKGSRFDVHLPTVETPCRAAS